MNDDAPMGGRKDDWIQEWDIGNNRILVVKGERVKEQATGERKHEKWMIVFDDPDRKPLFFEGLDARRTAAETHKKLCDSWTCELFLSAADLPVVAQQPTEGALREIDDELDRVLHGNDTGWHACVICGCPERGAHAVDCVMAKLRALAAQASSDTTRDGGWQVREVDFLAEWSKRHAAALADVWNTAVNELRGVAAPAIPQEPSMGAQRGSEKEGE